MLDQRVRLREHIDERGGGVQGADEVGGWKAVGPPPRRAVSRSAPKVTNSLQLTRLRRGKPRPKPFNSEVMPGPGLEPGRRFRQGILSFAPTSSQRSRVVTVETGVSAGPSELSNFPRFAC